MCSDRNLGSKDEMEKEIMLVYVKGIASLIRKKMNNIRAREFDFKPKNF